ncbi:hypothetical protein CIB95_08730 [Lottiidibacillus patelloidae]|uniref:Peptidase M50 domain-containing protein n=1 Tax=Lottiidibacillus patelloidae TaxID=2670334 RepID=A0A263BU40_9BACI|nr:hypothetical protein [Lottiidibacillus patelloidae]OZM56847.1 hypothetical protein CIB95_08730 [Lottiidibacillus patelloidae]
MTLILFLVFYVVVLPISTLIHEIGHALGILLTTKERAVIYLGPSDAKNTENFHLGRMHFHIKWSIFGSCKYKEITKKLTAFQQIVVAIGGPFMSLCLVLLFTSLAKVPTNEVIAQYLQAIAFANLFIFISTAIPIKYPKWMSHYGGMPSDGYRVVLALRK